MPALRIHRRQQEPTIESPDPPSSKPEATVEEDEPPAPKEPTTTRKSSSTEPAETGGGLAGLFGWGEDGSTSSSSTTSRSRTSSAPTPTPTIEEDDSDSFFGFGGNDETSTSSSRPTPRPTASRTSSHSAGPTETGPGLIDGMDTVVKSCGGSQDSSLISDDCKAAAQDNLFGAIILAVGALILLGFLILILKWFYVKFKSRRAPPRAATPAEKP